MRKLQDAMTGLLVGDALGLPFQFLDRDTFNCSDMVGYGTYNMPAGSFSDDGSMALATLDSLQNCDGIDLNDMANRFCDWLFKGAYTQYGRAYDMGGGTTMALEDYYAGVSVEECGGRGVRNNGNGSLMRILPMAFFEHTEADVAAVSAITHAHNIAMTACQIYVHIAENLLNGMDKLTAVKEATKAYTEDRYFHRLYTIETLQRDNIKSTGYVVDSIEAALWCLLTTKSYKECLLLAVNLGDDTDTVGAIVGGLAGIVYGIGGETGIPEDWANLVTEQDWVKKLIQ